LAQAALEGAALAHKILRPPPAMEQTDLVVAVAVAVQMRVLVELVALE
jgi:hypothetical protein